jgi:hypothetical protein
MIRVVAATSYVIQMTVAEYRSLVDYEKSLDNVRDVEYKDTLCGQLEAMDCFNVDHNGHFGPNIFYSLETEDDTEEKHQEILKLIESFVNPCVTIEVQS